MKKTIIFDIDGVLIDVSKSYRLAIKKTVEFFLNKKINKKEVEEIKLKPGFNDDYDAVNGILKKHNNKVPLKNIINIFQKYYLGKNLKGLIKNEKLLLRKSIIKKLSKKYTLTIFTGRSRKEASYPLKKYNIKKYFKIIMAVEDVKKKKPAPEGILKTLKRLKTKNAYYVGDSIDDLLAAKKAKVNFIGVIPPYGSRNLRKVLKGKGASVIINNINQITKVIK
jgi:HAD superfamily phosphatase